MPRKTSKPTHVSTDDVFGDLGFSTDEAVVMELKLTLHNELLKVVQKKKLTPRQVEKILDISQPKVSELLNGKIASTSVDRLTKYLHRLGRRVKVSTTAAKMREEKVA